MISGILAGGIPGFRIGLCCFCTLWMAHDDLWFLRLFLLMGLLSMTHKLSSACAELILSYHLLSQQIFFTQNWNLSRHCFAVVCFFVFCVGCFCLCLFFVLFLLLVLCVSVLVL